jgi:nitroreductase
MEDFNRLVTSRFSVRSYTNKKVEKELILQILDAARLAPSAVNYQPWHFIVISEPGNLHEIHEVYHREWFKQAPVCVVVCANRNESWKCKSDGKDFADMDIAIAVDHLILKATELGLGTCWICNFDAVLARTKLNLPDHIEPLVLVSLGYSIAEPPVKSRKPLSAMVHWENFTDL